MIRNILIIIFVVIFGVLIIALIQPKQMAFDAGNIGAIKLPGHTMHGVK